MDKQGSGSLEEAFRADADGNGLKTPPLAKLSSTRSSGRMKDLSVRGLFGKEKEKPAFHAGGEACSLVCSHGC